MNNLWIPDRMKDYFVEREDEILRALWQRETWRRVMFTAKQIGANILAKIQSHAGQHEEPMGSNSGPNVNNKLAYVGLAPGDPWCAAEASYDTGHVLEEMGLSHLTHLATGSSHEAVNWALRHGTKRDATTCVSGDWLIEAGGDGEPASDGKSYHHTTILDYVDADGTCHWIGGNTGDRVATGTCRIEDCFLLRAYVLV